MTTSPRSKNYRIIEKIRQIRNILQRADEGIGPYDRLFRQPDGSKDLTLLPPLILPIRI